jgi:hypothetical protein
VNLERFQEALRAEFTHGRDSVEYLASLIDVMHSKDHFYRQEAKLKLVRWLAEALDAPDTRARMRKFLRALDLADNPPTPQY